MQTNRAVLALSGGMDSATVLGYLLHKGFKVDAVSFTYGSKHNAYEAACAKKLCDHYGVNMKHFDLTAVMGEFNSALLKTGGAIPEGKYDDATMTQTVVPGRNMIFLTILAGFAESIGAKNVAIGIHQGDHAIYPDCRKEFFKSIDASIYLGTGGKVELMAPFVGVDKAGILKWGIQHEVPYQFTRTCYKDQPISCGKCGSCDERKAAFAQLDLKDPIPYDC